MIKDLTNLMKTNVEPFSTKEYLIDYICKYLLNYINLELQNLPKDHWDKTISTWIKMLDLAFFLEKKTEDERKSMYEKWKFDMVMEGIIEDLITTVRGFQKLKLLKKNSGKELLKTSIDMVKDIDYSVYDLNKDIITYIHNFLKIF